MDKVSLRELILSLEKWYKICEELEIKHDQKIVKDAINTFKVIQEEYLNDVLIYDKNSIYENNIRKIKSKNNKYRESFNDILDDYYNGINLKDKYNFKLITNKKDTSSKAIKDLWEECNFKKDIRVKELAIIYSILTKSKVEIKKRSKNDFIELLDNVVININRDKALDNIVI